MTGKGGLNAGGSRANDWTPAAEPVGSLSALIAPISPKSPATSGIPMPRRSENGVAARQGADRLLGLGERERVEAAQQAAVDQDHAVDVLVAGGAVEVP